MNTTMGAGLPDWLTPLAWVFVALALLSTVVIAKDACGHSRRHRTATSETS